MLCSCWSLFCSQPSRAVTTVTTAAPPSVLGTPALTCTATAQGSSSETRHLQGSLALIDNKSVSITCVLPQVSGGQGRAEVQPFLRGGCTAPSSFLASGGLQLQGGKTARSRLMLFTQKGKTRLCAPAAHAVLRTTLWDEEESLGWRCLGSGCCWGTHSWPYPTEKLFCF